VLRQESFNRNSDLTLRRLLYALECARSRLAVAMAAESKVTPPARWQSYIETEDRMRRCLKRLRVLHCALPLEALGWLPTLEALQHAPGRVDPGSQRGEAQHLCQFLGDVLARIEAQEKVMRDFDPPRERGR